VSDARQFGAAMFVFQMSRTMTIPSAVFFQSAR